jgi:hypothetical protein
LTKEEWEFLKSQSGISNFGFLLHEKKERVTEGWLALALREGESVEVNKGCYHNFFVTEMAVHCINDNHSIPTL